MSAMRRIADQSRTSGDFREVPNADAITLGGDRLDRGARELKKDPPAAKAGGSWKGS
jgi:hypothetical protein